MLAKRIIPCLDVKDGRVVKGVNFLDLRDAGDPVEQARFYENEGADELVFLDITASAEKRKTIVELARRTADQVFIPFTIGGGIGGLEDIREILKAGADKVSLNTAALLDSELISRAADRFGSQCVVVAIDARRRPGGWAVFIHGGRTPTGKDAVKWAREVQRRGAGEILLTSMDGDGTLSGYDLDLIQTVTRAVAVPVIASGGAGRLEDLYRGIVEGGAQAVLAASIFHFRRHSVREAKRFLRDRGIPGPAGAVAQTFLSVKKTPGKGVPVEKEAQTGMSVLLHVGIPVIKSVIGDPDHLVLDRLAGAADQVELPVLPAPQR